jgi:hypothetical protein
MEPWHELHLANEAKSAQRVQVEGLLELHAEARHAQRAFLVRRTAGELLEDGRCRRAPNIGEGLMYLFCAARSREGRQPAVERPSPLRVQRDPAQKQTATGTIAAVGGGLPPPPPPCEKRG